MSNITKHVLGLSGGKDSAALALYMAENFPEIDIEYFFTDTGSELPEAYDFLKKLEKKLQKNILWLDPVLRFNRNNDEGSQFKELLKEYNNFLPSAKARWCTIEMKIRPFEKWIAPTLKKGGRVISYIAIRADENRQGYKTTNPAMEAIFPLADAGIDKEGVLYILKNAGVGLPEYYEWRSRSGCTFCFYQQKIEWIRLKDRHPEAFKEAQLYEKMATESESKFTWCENETLEELTQPSRILEIEQDYNVRLEKLKKRRKKNPLLVGADDIDDTISIDDVFGVPEGKALCISCHK
jgi:3'-phosphoadenosine 5'-phosphosulfate sulfotransferase (PAPS reductase)/FAD synthetase